MLTVKDLTSLNDVIKNLDASITFKNFYSTLLKVPNKPEYLKLARQILFVLENELVTDHSLILYLLFVLFQLKENSKSLDFLSISLTLFKNKPYLPETVAYFIENLLSDNDQIKEISIYKPANILTMQIKFPLKPYVEKKSLQMILPVVMSDPDFINNQLGSEEAYECRDSLQKFIELLQTYTDEDYIEEFALNSTNGPEFIRIPPSISRPMLKDFSYERNLSAEWKLGDPLPGLSLNQPISSNNFNDDYIWLYPPANIHEFHFDYTIYDDYKFPEIPENSDFESGEDKSSVDDAESLINMAFDIVLTQAQQNQIVQFIQESPEIMERVSIAPENIPKIVQKNPVIAIEVLLRLIKSDLATEYFASLVKMEATIQSMEVVNRLATQINLPEEFLHIYISNCLKTCNKTEDKYMKTRLVRVVCVLLQALIRNKVLDTKKGNILVEIQSFCLEHNDVQAASQLYKLIKNIESNNNVYEES